jgi:putative hydrolase of the HAD superfamily
MTGRDEMRGIVFDLDDTLYPERQFVRSGYRAVAAMLRQQTGRDEPFAEWLWERFLAGQYRNAFNALDEQFGLALDPASLTQLVDCYRNHIPQIEPWADIPPLLDAITAAGWKLGLISDGPSLTQRNKLAALGLAGRFEAVIISGEQPDGSAKPDRAVFDAAQTQLDLPHEACCYIADNASKDFIGPNLLGWQSVQVIRPGQVHAGKAAPPGGQAKVILHGPAELAATIGLE